VAAAKNAKKASLAIGVVGDLPTFGCGHMRVLISHWLTRLLFNPA
jgi:hypothetical protein